LNAEIDLIKADEPEPSLRMQAVHGVKWTATASVVTNILLYARLAVLARLLSPKDFGLMGMALVIIALGQAFSDMGISNATISLLA
jgi:O-antigen/teichoic acid export membrane protein